MASPDQTARLIRLIRLATEIKTQPSQTPDELRRALGVGESQYFRDRDALAKIGFAYRWDRGRREHVIDRDVFLPALQLELTELFCLAMAVRQLSATGDFTLSFGAVQALKKVAAQAGSALQPLVRAAIDDLVLREGFGCRAEILDQLRRAIEKRQIVRIDYASASTGWTQQVHDVEPYLLFFRRRALYLDARCRETNDLRTYRVNRISAVEPLGGFFRLPDDYDAHERHLSAWELFAGNETRRVVVRFSPRVAHYIEEALFHPRQKIERMEDGGLLFSVAVYEPKEVAWWAMGWGADAEILEPADLRAWVREEIGRMGEKYAAKDLVDDPLRG